MHCCRIVNGIKNKNIKKQPWNKVECFAFGGGIVKSPKRFCMVGTRYFASATND